MNRILIAIVALSLASAVRAQEETTPDLATLDGKVTSLEEQYAETKATVAALNRIKVSGYIQARWVWQECVGNSPSKGCAYSTLMNNPATGQSITNGNPTQDNFFIRRARLKVVYDADWSQYVLQFDATPDGFAVKEAYASLKLPKGWAVDAGLQLFPFGYDVGVRSSADLDLLERYFGAGYYLKGEYDIGVALRGAYGPFNLRAGVFNGDGVQAGGHDNDQIKDLIGRLGFDFGMVTGGVSGWYGHTRDYHAYPNVTYDRSRIGADLQVFLDFIPIGGTALKGEYIAGKTGIGDSTNAGVGLGIPGYSWQASLVQNLGQPFQLAARLQQFVPNNDLEAPAKGAAVKEINEVDFALHYYLGGNFKFSVAYWHPWNGKTLGTVTDPLKVTNTVKDTDQVVAQAQVKF